MTHDDNMDYLRGQSGGPATSMYGLYGASLKDMEDRSRVTVQRPSVPAPKPIKAPRSWDDPSPQPRPQWREDEQEGDGDNLLEWIINHPGAFFLGENNERVLVLCLALGAVISFFAGVEHFGIFWALLLLPCGLVAGLLAYAAIILAVALFWGAVGIGLAVGAIWIAFEAIGLVCRAVLA